MKNKASKFIAKVNKTIKSYPKQFWIIFGGSFISSIGSGLIFPFFALYVRKKFGLSMTGVGYTIAAFILPSILSQSIGGHLADKFGRKIIMSVSLLLSSLFLLGYGFVETITLWIFLTILDGLFGPMYSPAGNAMVADIVDSSRRLQAYGLLRIINNLGIVIGPIIGGLLIARISYLILFIIASITSFIYFFVILFFIKETKPKKKEVYREQLYTLSDKKDNGNLSRYDNLSLEGYKKILNDKIFVFFCLITVLVSIVYSQMTTTFPVYMKENFGILEDRYGLIMALNASMVVLLQYPIARIISRYKKTRMMATGAFFYALGFGSIGLSNSFLLFAMNMAILTVGEMIIAPVNTSFVADISPEDMRGRYMGVFGIANMLGHGIGPIISGLFIDKLGGEFVWLIIFILGLISSAGYLSLQKGLSKN
jgi:MFS family permease